MAIGSKMFAVTVPLAAFVGSAAGVILAPWATEQIRARTGVSLASPPPPVLVAVPTPGPEPAIMPPMPSRVLPGAVLPSSSAPGTPTPAVAMAPVPRAGRTPFDSDSADEAPADPSKPGVAATREAYSMGDEADLIPAPEAELPLPADYFDITKLASTKGDGTDPPVLKPGQYLQVEVLEALPGRPITGTRVIRPDGTISLGFYGDLAVAGMNRNQIKVKLLERLVRTVGNRSLGLEMHDPEGKQVLVPAAATNRAFIDESLNFEPQATIPAPTRTVPFEPTGDLRDQIKALNSKVEHLLGQEPKPK